MSKTIAIEWLGKEIAETIAAYTENVSDAIDKEVERTAKAVQTEIKANSPERTGKYKKGWSRRKSTQGGATTYTIYNKGRPSIAHLLESGWTRRDGKRVPGKPHIKPAFDNHVPQMVRNIEQIIKGGG